MADLRTTCPRCGTPNRDQRRFCVSCGQHLAGGGAGGGSLPSEFQQQESPYDPPPEPSRRRPAPRARRQATFNWRVVRLVGAVFVVIALAVAGVAIGTQVQRTLAQHQTIGATAQAVTATVYAQGATATTAAGAVSTRIASFEAITSTAVTQRTVAAATRTSNALASTAYADSIAQMPTQTLPPTDTPQPSSTPLPTLTPLPLPTLRPLPTPLPLPTLPPLPAGSAAAAPPPTDTTPLVLSQLPTHPDTQPAPNDDVFVESTNTQVRTLSRPGEYIEAQVFVMSPSVAFDDLIAHYDDYLTPRNWSPPQRNREAQADPTRHPAVAWFRGNQTVTLVFVRNDNVAASTNGGGYLVLQVRTIQP